MRRSPALKYGERLKTDLRTQDGSGLPQFPKTLILP